MISQIVGDDARAEVIARTETMRASNQGQLEAWVRRPRRVCSRGPKVKNGSRRPTTGSVRFVNHSTD